MENQEEIWKTIKGHEDYKISNFGNVKSFKCGKERMLKTVQNKGGYLIVNLEENTKYVHKLVAITFLNHKPSYYKLVVNHKDYNRLNNNINNLEIITQRENTNQKHLKSKSKYVGVCWNKGVNKWQANIVINGKKKHLGLFINEIDASEAYQKKLMSIIKYNEKTTTIAFRVPISKVDEVKEVIKNKQTQWKIKN